MALYWKGIEIVPGMMLEVELYHHEAFDKTGKPVALRWKILSFDSRKSDEAYLDFSKGKKYPLKTVIKKKKLQSKLKNRQLLQLPTGNDFMVVQEYHDKKEVYKRCLSLDLLSTVREIRLAEQD
ncbi:MAG: hypothetical protein JEY99_17865 [Spirochaetales bacterium]|nr:hypothetical protein [Spirochaetales bacterium]